MIDDLTGNLPPLPDIFPDQMAPIIRVSEGKRRLEMMRWGIAGTASIRRCADHEHQEHEKPALAKVARARKPLSGSRSIRSANTPIRNLGRRQPGSRSMRPGRCSLSPGIWTRVAWRAAARKPTRWMAEHQLYGFLTTDANDVVGLIHPKAMPVLLTTTEEYDVWLRAPWSEAAALQRLFTQRDDVRIVGDGGKKEDQHDEMTTSIPTAAPIQLNLL